MAEQEPDDLLLALEWHAGKSGQGFEGMWHPIPGRLIYRAVEEIRALRTIVGAEQRNVVHDAIKINEKLMVLFDRDPNLAQLWSTTPNAELGGATPFAATIDGKAPEVLALLDRLLQQKTSEV